MEIEKINFVNPPNHINEYLTHWTGRDKGANEAYSILSQILKSERLRFGNCENSFHFENGKIKSKMICFTDTPIVQSLEHCQRYDYFGISFNKDKLIERGANPVLYLVENRKENQEFLIDFTMGSGKFQNYFEQWVNLRELFYRDNELRNKLSWFSSISQPYKTEKVVSKGFAEYLEREWRIIRVLPTKFTDNTIKIGGEYNENLSGDIICEDSTSSSIEEVCYLPFDFSFVENVIVLDEGTYVDDCKKLMHDIGLDCKLLVVSKTKLKDENK